MDKKLLTIGEVAQILGVSIDTLRRWEKENILPSFRPAPTSKRYYRKEDIDQFFKKDRKTITDDLVEMAKKWAMTENPTQPDSSYYCETSDIFYARLQRLERELQKIHGLENIFPLVVAIAGEIGNNSYNHNIGNWPDMPGIFFGYNIQKKQVVLADRGQGIYTTLKRVLPKLKNDQEALQAAFTQYISGRAPEERGNGLKFVKDIVSKNPLHLIFFTGNTKLELQQHDLDIHTKTSNQVFHGCLAIITF